MFLSFIDVTLQQAGAGAVKKDSKERSALSPQTAKVIEGHSVVNRFFQAFIDHVSKII